MSLSSTLSDLATLAAIKGDDEEAAFYRRAASLVSGKDGGTALAGLLADPPAGADERALARWRSLHEHGPSALVEAAVADLPQDLRRLLTSGAVTIDQLAALHHELDVVTAADLHTAAGGHAIRDAGMGPDVEAAVAGALGSLRPPASRIPLGRAVATAEPVLDRLRQTDGVAWAEPAGSLRRGEELIGDIEVVAAARDPAAVLEAALDVTDGARILHRGTRRLVLRQDRSEIAIRCLAPETAGARLLHLTGSRTHLDHLRARAHRRGWRLASDGLYRDAGATVAADEGEIFAALDLPFIPPEIREGDEAIRLADAGRLQALVSAADIRGDLHMHTTWSDGRDSAEAMVQACLRLGYEYLAITDHSPSSAASRNLTVDGVKRQADEIAALRDRYPQIAILHGCEVDILPGGRLDFDDRVLQTFDIVLASLHDGAGDPPERLLARYREAMRHPLVSIITHPANRTLPFGPGYDLDFERLFEIAIQTSTAVEIDGAPAHIDLDAARARQAAEAGAMLSIDSDSHRTEALGRNMRTALLIARRAWVQPRQVVNTRPLADVLAIVAAKRDGRRYPSTRSC